MTTLTQLFLALVFGGSAKVVCNQLDLTPFGLSSSVSYLSFTHLATATHQAHFSHRRYKRTRGLCSWKAFACIMPDDISLAKASHNQAGTNGSGG
jgi:hypothetical protein